jgi:hypothetical protein
MKMVCFRHLAKEAKAIHVRCQIRTDNHSANKKFSVHGGLSELRAVNWSPRHFARGVFSQSVWIMLGFRWHSPVPPAGAHFAVISTPVRGVSSGMENLLYPTLQFAVGRIDHDSDPPSEIP